jgi:ferrous iron transport protein A
MNHDETLISLACMEAGCSGVVDHAQGGYGLHSCLNALGITPGKKITRISPILIKGPITIEVDNKQVIVGFGMAARIMVRTKENICDH